MRFKGVSDTGAMIEDGRWKIGAEEHGGGVVFTLAISIGTHTIYDTPTLSKKMGLVASDAWSRQDVINGLSMQTVFVYCLAHFFLACHPFVK